LIIWEMNCICCWNTFSVVLNDESTANTTCAWTVLHKSEIQKLQIVVFSMERKSTAVNHHCLWRPIFLDFDVYLYKQIFILSNIFLFP
jgi:hypothetical protein